MPKEEKLTVKEQILREKARQRKKKNRGRKRKARPGPQSTTAAVFTRPRAPQIASYPTPPESAEYLGKKYAMTLLHPKNAGPAFIPDGTLRPRTCLQVIKRMITSTAVDSKDSTYYASVVFSPFAADKNNTGTGFGTVSAGVPNAVTTGSDLGYTTWSSLVDQYRPVSMEVRARPYSSITSSNGAMGFLVTQKDKPAAQTTASYLTLYQIPGAVVMPYNEIGKTFKATWLPLNEEDKAFVPYNTTAASNASTVIWFFSNNTGAAQSWEIEIITNYEVLPLPDVTQFFDTKTVYADPSSASRAMTNALQRHSISDVSRSLSNSDQDDDALFKADAKALGTSIRRFIKSGASRLGSYLSDMVGLPASEKAKRIMESHLWDSDVYDCITTRVREEAMSEAKSNSSYAHLEEKEDLPSSRSSSRQRKP